MLPSVADSSRPHTVSPQVRILREDFWMPQLNRRRRIWLYLPADYDQQPARRYPVLYLQDGQNVFDEATSYAGEWGVDETLDELYTSGRDTTGCIVVAIDNGGPFRGDEYIPWRNEAQKVGGQGTAYVDFLALTLKPFIDRSFRTRPDAANTGIAGSSLGGLISVYAALRYPKVFGRVGAFSPSFWICNAQMLDYVRKRPAGPGTKFYFVGGQEESRWMVPQMTAWHDLLRASGVPAAHLFLHAPADGKHQEWFWRREFAAAYEWLFEPNKTKQ